MRSLIEKSVFAQLHNINQFESDMLWERKIYVSYMRIDPHIHMFLVHLILA